MARQLILALSLLGFLCCTFAQDTTQTITNKESQGFGTAHCLKCGENTDSESAAAGFKGTGISSCFLTYGGLAANDTTSGAPNTVFECSCKPAFQGNGVNCTNVDECKELTDNCDNNARCTDLPGSFRCDCIEGFTGTGVDCDDIDECAASENPCGETDGKDHGECVNTAGSYQCNCRDGFKLENGYCADINECDDPSLNPCTKPNEKCINSVGSYECSCVTGYKYNDTDNSACVDMNECEEDKDNCGTFTKCINSIGSFYCNCETDKFRFRNGSSTDCEDINECVEQTYACDQSNRRVCNNTDGGYMCDCNPGYTLHSISFRGHSEEACSDVNECLRPEMNACNPNAKCTNTPGSYTCACKEGFTGDGISCKDINECNTAADNECNKDFGTCTNNEGSYECSCIYGYTGDGKTCTVVGGSIDELQKNRTALSSYALRVQIHQEDVEKERLLLEREILMRKCALKEQQERTKRAVVEYDDLSDQDAELYLRTLQSYNSAVRLANHRLEISCEVTALENPSI